MGAQHSTRPHSLAIADAGASGGDGHAHLPCLAELMSYEEAYRLDPELETFDSTLHKHTGRAISTLTDGVQVRSLSLDSLREITGCLLEMNQEVVKVILDCKLDVLKNIELFDLAEDYFQNNLQTLDFYTTLEKYLTKARDNQLILQVALQHFTEEEEDHKGDNARNSRTLTELRHFKAAGDPFTEEYLKREDATNDLNTAIETGDLEGIEKYSKRTIKNKSTGELSFLTCFMNFAGSIVRVFTSIQENAPVSGISLLLIINPSG
ncbi:hypothetical protein ZIOFF_048813 [Zingiber officinale]|uniref:Uncharacterized protein n=1 Tax=Zingiber officinale TaxID=94328 RepID=A0A8J5G8A9_ZINOF|nr:hypothetical protein ZIOFF_048813 [Zingiber officinale]